MNFLFLFVILIALGIINLILGLLWTSSPKYRTVGSCLFWILGLFAVFGIYLVFLASVD